MLCGGGFAPPTQEVGCDVGRHYVPFGAVMYWTSGGQFIGNRMVLLWVCFGPLQLPVH